MASQPNPPEPDAAHVPMTEEFDSFKHTMPDALPIAIAMALVMIAVGVVGYFVRSKPVAVGSIDDAFAVTVPGQNSSLAIVTLDFKNVTQKPLRLINVNIAVHTKGADYKDDFGSATDFPRYFAAFPALAQHAKPGIIRDTKLAPGAKVLGAVMVSLPISQEDFDARDSLTATLTFDNYPLVKITSKKQK